MPRLCVGLSRHKAAPTLVCFAIYALLRQFAKTRPLETLLRRVKSSRFCDRLAICASEATIKVGRTGSVLQFINPMRRTEPVLPTKATGESGSPTNFGL